MITFNNVRFLNRPTKTFRQLVGVDVTLNSTTYDWIVYTPDSNGAELEAYFDTISTIVENDITRKESIWASMPHTEIVTDPFTNSQITVDIPKERIVSPTVPDYIEVLAETGFSNPSRLSETLTAVGEDYWHYPQYAKRIIAPQELIFDDNGIKMYGWFNINNFPILKLGTNLNLYCNTILPDHQTIVDAFGGSITIEDRP